ncbi:putative glycosidase C21B10.07 [Leucoagaricus sp. SymC.cos]|nr:putative glycosidase C21B10.07 [Leucoagaricus sp. SymC.cos]
MPLTRLKTVVSGALSLMTILGSLVLLVHADKYDITKEYIGSTFFDEWTFYDHYDNLTNGDAVFVGAAQAASDKLAFVDSVTNHAIIKVDNTSTVVKPNKRNTVRIQTNHMFSVGSLWVVDMLHVPYGCAVWPAFWSKSPSWPDGGEIDTFEGVNLDQHNSMALHTNQGCSQVSPVQTANSTWITSTDCSVSSNQNQGCIVKDPNTTSYGAAFANAGGGVWITEYAESGISIWFMPRANVPSVISSNSSTIDTSALGTPIANWPTGGCDMKKFFSPQNIVFDITLCGDLARPPNIFSQQCPGVCYDDWVVGSGANFNTAYFEVASLRIFSKSGTNTVISTNSATELLNASRGVVMSVATLLCVGLTRWITGL